jgi:signal transduction histidine kinase
VVVTLVPNPLKFAAEGPAAEAAAWSDDGGDASAVVVRVQPAPGEVVVAVSDHGPGIPKADQGRIFERFYKVDRVRVRGGGTGLGLAIARHVVQQHGGRIWVESEEGSGSTFSFAIPTPAAGQPSE